MIRNSQLQARNTQCARPSIYKHVVSRFSPQPCAVWAQAARRRHGAVAAAAAAPPADALAVADGLPIRECIAEILAGLDDSNCMVLQVIVTTRHAVAWSRTTWTGLARARGARNLCRPPQQACSMPSWQASKRNPPCTNSPRRAQAPRRPAPLAGAPRCGEDDSRAARAAAARPRLSGGRQAHHGAAGATQAAAARRGVRRITGRRARRRSPAAACYSRGPRGV